MSDAATDDFLRHIVGGCFWRGKPKRVGVAVSGGSDSMALLDLMQNWAAAEDVEVLSATVDHGLRVEAKDEAARVAGFCASKGIPHDILTWESWDGTGNMQAEARNARFFLLAEWAREKDLEYVALGHSADDQAETFLMRLARKAGVDGLAGMRPHVTRHDVEFVRPLLGQTRLELQDYLLRHEITWITDPSNSDQRFERVKAREAMEHLTHLGITGPGIAQSAHHLSIAASTLAHYTWVESEKHVEEDRGDVSLSKSPHLPIEIERRLLSGALQFVGGGTYAPREAAMMQLDIAMLEAKHHTLAGCLVSKETSGFRVTREWNAVAEMEGATDALWDGRWTFDGPHESALTIRALGESGLQDCPDWRGVGMPRASLLASPAVWRGEELIAAPVAGLENGWTTKARSFSQFLLSRDR